MLEGGNRGWDTILDVLKRSSDRYSLGTRKVGSSYGTVNKNTERGNRAEGA